MPAPPPWARFVLVLSGGNALGAYQGGAYGALQAAGWEPDWIVGASAGAINGALICGSPPSQRVEGLREWWRPDPGTRPYAIAAMEEMRRTAAAVASLTMGQPGQFAPRLSFAGAWASSGADGAPALFDSTPMRKTLARRIDFDRLNRGLPRFTAMAVDVESGEDRSFDTSATVIGPDHLRASSALLPAFPPVHIDGRWYADAGFSANLPLDPVLGEDEQAPLLCIAVDLLPLRAPVPRTLGDAAVRAQDLMFAIQSRRTIAAWQAIFDQRVATGSARSVTLVHLAYADPVLEVSGKAFDFSPASSGARWRAGAADMAHAIEHIRSVTDPSPGLKVITPLARD